jgi:hypothetical protein
MHRTLKRLLQEFSIWGVNQSCHALALLPEPVSSRASREFQDTALLRMSAEIAIEPMISVVLTRISATSSLGDLLKSEQV